MKAHWLTDEEIRALADVELSLRITESPDSVRIYRSSGETQYYYWDETWSQCFGPFNCETACRVSLNAYARSL